MTELIDNIGQFISDVVSHYWQTREAQRNKEGKMGMQPINFIIKLGRN